MSAGKCMKIHRKELVEQTFGANSACVSISSDATRSASAGGSVVLEGAVHVAS